MTNMHSLSLPSLFSVSVKNQIIIPCCLAVLVALAAGEATAADKKDTAKVNDQSADSTVKTKRGLHSFGGEYGGYGGGYGGGWYPSHHIGEYSACGGGI